MGRLLLARNDTDDALLYLEEAAALDPDEHDYWFWLGVAHWADGDLAKERRAYERALEIDPDYIPARLYLGHNLKNSGRLSEALEHYDKVLVQAPRHPDALFNRADILQNTGMRGLAVPAWKKYLDYYPDGSKAREAALALNGLGDFSYRIHVIGVRQIVLERIVLAPDGDTVSDDSTQSVEVVATMLEQDPSLALEIAAYDDAGEDAARYRAAVVRDALVESGAAPGQVGIAAYGRPERIRAGGKIHTLDDSIVFRNPRP
jgi:tetratricopeptide (TPR) repeat protein